jgi:hypothetical protein
MAAQWKAIQSAATGLDVDDSADELESFVAVFQDQPIMSLQVALRW